MQWQDSPELDCQCGQRFAGAYAHDRFGSLVSRAPCPGCGSTGRLYRAAIAGFAGLEEAPAPAVADQPPGPAPAPPPARVEAPPARAPMLGAPKPRAPLQGSLGL